MLYDHDSADALALVPMPTTAAFDPTCRLVAVAHGGDDVVLVDRAARAVVGRFALRPPAA